MGTSSKKYKYHPNPRLSANQVAEYLTATSTRRKGIIRDAKFPKTAVVARYDAAREALIKHLSDDTRSHHVLSEAIIGLDRREESAGATSWIKNDCRLSKEAIVAFQRAYNKLGVSKLVFRSAPGRVLQLEIEGVKLSIALDLIASRTDSSGTKRVGGVIFMFNKSDSSPKSKKNKAEVAALLALQFIEKHLKHLGQPDPKLCIAIDVFGGEAYPVKGSSRRLKDIGNSCEEVALWWPKVKPPVDYDGPPVT
ncbi:MAG: hypothetical protein GC131_00585 [Alphaproteobacteria bacterium]|nr:hypothetical protein [Alphaproteobacteria bacterium]